MVEGVVSTMRCMSTNKRHAPRAETSVAFDNAIAAAITKMKTIDPELASTR